MPGGSPAGRARSRARGAAATDRGALRGPAERRALPTDESASWRRRRRGRANNGLRPAGAGRADLQLGRRGAHHERGGEQLGGDRLDAARLGTRTRAAPGSVNRYAAALDRSRLENVTRCRRDHDHVSRFDERAGEARVLTVRSAGRRAAPGSGVGEAEATLTGRAVRSRCSVPGSRLRRRRPAARDAAGHRRADGVGASATPSAVPWTRGTAREAASLEGKTMSDDRSCRGPVHRGTAPGWRSPPQRGPPSGRPDRRSMRPRRRDLAAPIDRE